MSLLAESPALDLYDREWVVHTRSEERAPSKLGPKAEIAGNMLSNGCRVDGVVERSILSPGVYVAEGAIVRDSVILSDTVIGPGAVVDRCIVDKYVQIGAGARVGDGDDNTPNGSMPEQINTGITLLGKRSVVPDSMTVGRNVVIHAHTGAELYKRKKVASGSDVGKSMR
jgi:glucose-1-phosphate adenylyltransferase